MSLLQSINFEVLSGDRTYSGHELRPHYLLSQGIKGSAIGVFMGPCQVNTAELVDWEDKLAHDHIRAKQMLHFLGEFFAMSLSEGVLLQRFFMGLLYEILSQQFLKPEYKIVREGDDLYVESSENKLPRSKLSVSIVTASPVSSLLHVGINIDSEGAPVQAVGLSQIGVDPIKFTECVKSRFLSEWKDMSWACTKVRPVV